MINVLKQYRIGLICFLASPLFAFGQQDAAHDVFKLSRNSYVDRVQAIWSAQIIAATMGFPFEHTVSSAQWIDSFQLKDHTIPVDDDWYYEMVALRAFEKYGIHMTIDDLGKQWIENSAGTWGSSRETLRLLKAGIPASETGHPRHNKLWFTIGPQFSADIYGALTPGMPGRAGELARKFGRINGHAEAVDGAIFIAGMISLGFAENDPTIIVRQAANLIDRRSPYKKCIELVIAMAENGATFPEVINAVEDRWHIEYPATNNAVANGGIVAASVWFGKGDFLTTVNLALSAADFVDTDCNAANAASVIGAMHGLKGIPDYLLNILGDKIVGESMGGLTLTPAVDESLTTLAERTAEVGIKLLKSYGSKIQGNNLTIRKQQPTEIKNEQFNLSELTRYWNPEWELHRAGFGGGSGGMRLRGNTFLQGDVLATYPRDEVRAVLLKQTISNAAGKILEIEVGADSGRSWQLEIYMNNERVFRKTIEGRQKDRSWQKVKVEFPSKPERVTVRLFQRVLVPGREAGNAYWKNCRIIE